MIHGAAAATPMTIVENVSRPDEKIVSTDLASLPQAIGDAGIKGPAIIFLGLTPRDAVRRLVANDTLRAQGL